MLDAVCTQVTSPAASRDSAVTLTTDSYQFWVAHKNDFTSVSSKGCSVFDYCIASHVQLSDFQDFKVVRASELINTCGISVSDVAPASIPDRSCLLWHIINGSINMFITPVNSDESYKYDVRRCLPPSLAMMYFWVR